MNCSTCITRCQLICLLPVVQVTSLIVQYKLQQGNELEVWGDGSLLSLAGCPAQLNISLW